MKQTRAQFKVTLRWCKRHEEQIKADTLDKTVKYADPKQFWKAVRNSNVENMIQCSRVGDVYGTNNVAEMWQNHYEQIYNCIEVSVNKSKLLSKLNYMQKVLNFTVQELMLAAQNQKLGKACGSDCLYMEPYIYGSSKLFVIL